MEIPKLDYQNEYSCPICSSKIYRSGESFGVVTLMAISTLITLFWAVTLPILDIDVLGISRKISLWDSFFILLQENHFLTAMILLFSVIIIPITMLIIIFSILLHLFFKISVRKVSFLFRCYERIKEWNMIEVYLVSVLVSMIKLNDISEMTIDNGLWFFMIYLLFFYITLKFFNSHDIWHKELYERY